MTENPIPNIDSPNEDDTSVSELPIRKKTSFKVKVRRIFEAIKPIITSHHPKCEQYQDHTFHLFGRDWCIGCYVGYPSGIFMLIIGFTTGLFTNLPSRTLWVVGGCMMTTYLFSIFGLTKTRWTKIVSKIPLGFGAAFVIGAIFSYEIKIWLSLLFSFLFLQFFLTIINIKRALEMRKTCNNCEYKEEHNKCPGMHPIMERLNKINKK